MNWLLFFFKAQCVCFLLMKVSLLLKYFMFVKFRSEDWKARHLIFFPEAEIIFSKSLTCVKAKKIQNVLSTSFAQLMIMVVLIRLVMKLIE